MHAPPFRWQLLLPQHWPAWLGLGLMRLLVMLPVRWQIALGEFLGGAFGRLAGSRRHIVRTNLRLCFPQRSPQEIEQLTDAHLRALGAGLFEAALCWWASDDKLRAHVRVEGLEHLHAALAGGTGALLLTGHFTTLELAARTIYMAGVPFHAMYRPYSSAVFDWFMYRKRELRSGLPPLPRDEIRATVKALRAGKPIWYAPDQTLDERLSVFVPFFGVPTQTITATARLAQMGRARVVPYFPRRDGAQWVVTIHPALDGFPSGDETADTLRINQVLEDGVRAALPQYFWVHRRFKKRPPGEAGVY